MTGPTPPAALPGVALFNARLRLQHIDRELARYTDGDIPSSADFVTGKAAEAAESAIALWNERVGLVAELPGLIARAHTRARSIRAALFGHPCAHPGCSDYIDAGEVFVRLTTPTCHPQDLHTFCAQILSGRPVSDLLPAGDCPECGGGCLHPDQHGYAPGGQS